MTEKTGSERVAVLRTRDQLAETIDDWHALERHSRFPMSSHEWVTACARHLYADGRLRVAVASRDGRLSAVAPLALSGRALGSRLELAGVPTLYEPMDVLAAGTEELARVITEARRLRLALRLDRLSADSPAVGLVRDIYRPGVVVVRPAVAYPYLALGPGWCDPASQLSSKRRADLRRAQRRAEAMGRVDASIVAPAEGEVDGLLDTAFAVEARSWKTGRGTALAVDAGRAPFYREYAHLAARRGQLRVALLRIDGENAAMQLAVEWGQAYWLLKIGYDERWARCSPGVLLVAESIRYAATRGLRTYEFLGNVEPWIAAWTDTARSLVNLRAYPPSMRSACVLVSDVAAALGQYGTRTLKTFNHRCRQLVKTSFAHSPTGSPAAPPGATSSATTSATPSAPAGDSPGRTSAPPLVTGTARENLPAKSSTSASASSPTSPA